MFYYMVNWAMFYYRVNWAMFLLQFKLGHVAITG